MMNSKKTKDVLGTRVAGDKTKGWTKMTTDLMECWSLEEGDQIVISGNVYRIIDFSCNFSEDDEYIFTVVDEEGYRREIVAEGSQKFRIVCDTDHNEYA